MSKSFFIFKTEKITSHKKTINKIDYLKNFFNVSKFVTKYL